MNKKLKISIVIIAILAIAGCFGYNYILHGGARNITDEKTEIVIDSKTILNDFATNTDLANKKYLEKAIEISGTITAVNDTIITLNNNIICGFKTADKSIKTNQNATIKGRVVGFDDLMGELKLDNCLLITN